jgi:hypothetical protein
MSSVLANPSSTRSTLPPPYWPRSRGLTISPLSGRHLGAGATLQTHLTPPAVYVSSTSDCYGSVWSPVCRPGPPECAGIARRRSFHVPSRSGPVCRHRLRRDERTLDQLLNVAPNQSRAGLELLRAAGKVQGVDRVTTGYGETDELLDGQPRVAVFTAIVVSGVTAGPYRTEQFGDLRMLAISFSTVGRAALASRLASLAASFSTPGMPPPQLCAAPR